MKLNQGQKLMRDDSKVRWQSREPRQQRKQMKQRRAGAAEVCRQQMEWDHRGMRPQLQTQATGQQASATKRENTTNRDSMWKYDRATDKILWKMWMTRHGSKEEEKMKDTNRNNNS